MFETNSPIQDLDNTVSTGMHCLGHFNNVYDDDDDTESNIEYRHSAVYDCWPD